MARSLTRGSGLALALLASSLLHVALLLFWPSPRVWRPPAGLAPAPERSLSLSLAAARPSAPDTGRPQRPAAPGPREPLREGAGAPEPRAALPDPAPESTPESTPEPASEVPLRRARDLDLRLPDLALPQRPSASPLSARVFDPELARRLGDLRRRGERAPRAAPRRSWLDDSRWVGGRLETLVNVGGRCFRVIEADPLDSLSFEQWFPARCL